MMLGDYFEYAEHLPPITINSIAWTPIFTHTTQSVPPNTYLIAFNFAWQSSYFDSGYVNFRFLVDGSVIEDDSDLLETDPGPGTGQSRETSCSFFRATFSTPGTHLIEMQARIGGGSPAHYARDIRMTFYEEDLARAVFNYYSASGQGTNSTSWQDVLNVNITTPPEGTTYSIWAKANFSTHKGFATRDIYFRVVIDGSTVPEIGSQNYNTQHSNDNRWNVWAKNANCIYLDEGPHSVKIQAKNSGGFGYYPVRWNQQSLRVLRHL
jgi:hypothetical protein